MGISWLFPMGKNLNGTNEWVYNWVFILAFHQTFGVREKIGHGGTMGVTGHSQNTITTAWDLIQHVTHKENQEIQGD